MAIWTRPWQTAQTLWQGPRPLAEHAVGDTLDIMQQVAPKARAVSAEKLAQSGGRYAAWVLATPRGSRFVMQWTREAVAADVMRE